MKQMITFFWLAICVVATSWSLLHPGLFQLHDPTHAARISQMTLALQDGHFPVRWVKDFGVGYGMPLFEFYAPLPYYLGTLLHLTGLPMEWVIKSLMVIAGLGTAVGAYLTGRWLSGRVEAGWVTAAALTLAPYRAVNLFVRGAFSEAWGMMGAVWVLAGLVMTVKRQRGGHWALLFGWVTLILSHNLTLMMFLPMLVVFGFVLWLTEKPRPSREALKTIGVYTLLGWGLSAFYLVPLLMEKSLINTEGFTQAFPYAQHFVYSFQWVRPLWGYGGSAPLPYNDQSYFLGYPQLVLLGLAVSLALWQWTRSRKLGALQWWLVGVGGLLALSLGLMHPRALVVWDYVPLLQILQFPWRWLGMSSLWLAVIGGVGIGSITSTRVRVGLAVIASLALVASNTGFFHPKAYLEDNQQLYFTQPELIRQQQSPGYIDYLPRAVSDLTPVTELVASSSGMSFTVLENTTRLKRLSLTVKQPTAVEFNLADFPHWHVKLDEQKVTPESTGWGTFKVQVPVGEHETEIELVGSLSWKVGNVISLMTLLFLVYVQRRRITSASRK